MEFDGGWGWIVVAASFCISVLADGVRYSYGLLYYELLYEFGRGKGETSWIGSIMFGTYGLAAPLASIVIDKFGCRCSVILGCLIVFAAFVTSVFATSVYDLYFSFGILGGVGSVLMMLPINVAIVQYFHKKRSLAMGIAMCGSGVGTIIFNPLSKFLIDEYKWRGALLIEAALLLNVGIFGSVMRPVKDTPKHNDTTNAIAADVSVESECQSIPNEHQKTGAHSKRKRTETNSDDDIPPSERKSRFSCKTVTDALGTIYHFELLKNGGILIFMLSIIFIGLSFMVPFTFLPDMMVSIGLTREDATWMLTAIGIANVVVRVPAGIMGDRTCISRWKVYMASTMTAGLSIAAMALARNYFVLMAVCTVFGLAIGIALVLLPVILADIFGDDLIADSFGLILFASGISELIGAPLAGWIFDKSGTYLISFIIAGVEYCLGGLLLILVPHCRRTHAQ